MSKNLEQMSLDELLALYKKNKGEIKETCEKIKKIQEKCIRMINNHKYIIE